MERPITEMSFDERVDLVRDELAKEADHLDTIKQPRGAERLRWLNEVLSLGRIARCSSHNREPE